MCLSWQSADGLWQLRKVLFLWATNMLISSPSVRPYWLFVRVNFPFPAWRQGGYNALKLICCVIPLKNRPSSQRLVTCEAAFTPCTFGLSPSPLRAACSWGHRKVLNVWNTKPPSFTCWKRTPLLVWAALLCLCNRLCKEKLLSHACKSAAAKRTLKS